MARPVVQFLALAGLGAAGAWDDSTVLLQGKSSTRQAANMTSRYEAPWLLTPFPGMKKTKSTSGTPAPALPAPLPPFDCSKYPALCQAPFHCEKNPTPVEMQERLLTMAKNGHANFHTWCRNQAYWDTVVQHCLIENNPVKGAWSLYYKTRRGELGQFTDEMDASYCFMEGHCSNGAVTAHTTVSEAEKMCDARFGHKLWAHDFGYRNLSKLDELLPNSMGFSDRQFTKWFVVMSCAMGNYHCDVMYCKETYCKNSYYENKYKHLAPRRPGHKLVERD